LTSGRALFPSFAPARPRKVLWFSGEDPDPELHRRFKRIQDAHERKEVIRHQPGMIIIDPLAAFEPNGGKRRKARIRPTRTRRRFTKCGLSSQRKGLTGRSPCASLRRWPRPLATWR